MPKVKDLSVDDLEYLIEEKIMELLGDPDSGLELTNEFKEKLRERLDERCTRIPHEEVLRRLGARE